MPPTTVFATSSLRRIICQKLMLHPQWSWIVAGNVIFDHKRRGGNSSGPVTGFVELRKYDKPSEVTLPKRVARAGSFLFHDLDRASRRECSRKQMRFNRA